jgi:hypothetical protein
VHPYKRPRYEADSDFKTALHTSGREIDHIVDLNVSIQFSLCSRLG